MGGDVLEVAGGSERGGEMNKEEYLNGFHEGYVEAYKEIFSWLREVSDGKTPWTLESVQEFILFRTGASEEFREKIYER